MERRRGLPFVVASLLVAVACTGSSDPASSLSASPTSAGGVATPPGAASLPGTLLVLDGTGSLVTLRPDGTGRVTLAVQAPGSLQVSQAAWAPDGARVAWSQVDDRDGSPTARVITSTPGGAERVETTVGFVPFYLSWDPTSRHVAYLGNRGDDVGLGVVAGASGPEPRDTGLDRGSPYYFSWSPGGDRMLVHVGDDRLEELTIDGAITTKVDRPGVFQAPAWSSDGSIRVYVRRGRGLTQGLIAQVDGETREVATPKGAVFMVLSPDGRHLAYQALEPDELDIYDRTLPERATDVGVTVLDLRSGEIQHVSSEVAAAWYWSPDGSRLAVLEPVYASDGPITFRWRIWGGSASFTTPVFSPGLTLLQSYQPFFSQYAQSMSMWAPDGSAFAFPIEVPGSLTSIVVQPVDRDEPPYLVSEGTFAAWSPT